LFKIKPRHTSIIQVMFIGMFFVCLLGIAVTACFWIMSDIRQNKNQIAYETERETLFQKQILKEQVSEVIQYIEYMKPKTENQLKASIRQKIHEAHKIAETLYHKNKEKLTDEQIQSLIRETLRAVRFNDGRGYYFITSLEGVEILFTDRPQLEGKNILDMQDINGKYVIQDMIQLVREKQEGFYEYHWTQPGKGEDRVHRKIAFIKLFEPYNWFIGTGEYLNDVEAEIQAEVIDRIEHIKFSETGYVFAGTLDGLSLSGPAKGKNMIDIKDVNGVNIVQELISRANAGGGFVEYELPAFEGYVAHKKISYSMAIPGWQWYVGAGLNKENFEGLALEKKKELKERIQKNILYILFFFAALLTIISIAFSVISRRIRSAFQALELFFQTAVTEKKKIDTDSFHFTEFQTLSASANKMIEKINASEQQIRENQALLIQAEKMSSLGGLAAGMAHEINNPLGIIMGAIQNAQRHLDPAMAKNREIATESGLDFDKAIQYLEKRSILLYLNSIKTASERAAEIVKKMLGFSRKSESTKSLHQVSILMDNAIEMAGSDYDLKKKYDFKTIRIIREYDPDLSLFCNGSEITHVVLNILKNAAQAMEDRGGRKDTPPEIIIRSIDQGESCLLEIIDNGPGMDSAHKEKIFEPFFTTKAPGQGTGLGLSVSYFIISRNHNGIIEVESELDRGTRFIIRLPMPLKDNALDTNFWLAPI